MCLMLTGNNYLRMVEPTWRFSESPTYNITVKILWLNQSQLENSLPVHFQLASVSLKSFLEYSASKRRMRSIHLLALGR